MRGLFVTGDRHRRRQDRRDRRDRRSRCAARGIDVGVAKPVQSGALADDPGGDAMLLRGGAAVRTPRRRSCPYSFAAPLAPLVAAQLEGRAVDARGRASRACRRLAATPRRRRRRGRRRADRAGRARLDGRRPRRLRSGCRVLVVARAGLGTVNHTLLTVGAAAVARARAGRRRAERPPPDDRASQTNAELIEELAERSACSAHAVARRRSRRSASSSKTTSTSMPSIPLKEVARV